MASLASATRWDPVELHRLTGGIPFVLTELIGSAPGQTTSVHDTVLARADRLESAAREVLDAVALLSERADATLLLTSIDDFEAGVEACVAAGLLVYDGDRVGFRHELAREVIVGSVSPPRRARLHRQLLAALLATGNADAAGARSR